MQTKQAKHPAVTYFIVPLCYWLGIFLLLGIVFTPILKPYVGLASYFFSKKAPEQSSDLFAQVSDNIANNGTIAKSTIQYPKLGDRYANITISSGSVDAPIYYGDATKQLNQGVGTYADNSAAGIPGEGKTILLAAHNNTFFNGLQDVKEGDTIQIETHYGVYEYRITEMRIAEYTDKTTYDFTREDENLILYTCYPFDAIGFTSQRYFVYGEFVSGPVIDAAA